MPMSKNEPVVDFADVLAATIAQHYGTAEAFAAATGYAVVASTVGRWLNRRGLPSARKIDELAPWVRDAHGNPIPASRLVALAYPNLAPDYDVKIIYLASVIHPLAREVNDLLAPGSPMPAGERRRLAGLADALINPYRRYLHKREGA